MFGVVFFSFTLHGNSAHSDDNIKSCLLHDCVSYKVVYSISGKQKCMQKGGDCLVKHTGVHTTGLAMVVGTTVNPLRYNVCLSA